MTTTRVMLVTKRLDASPLGGRQMLCQVNHDILSAVFGSNLLVYELPAALPFKSRFFLSYLNGYIDGLNDQVINDAISIVKRENISMVFVDGSNLGAFVYALKRCLKHIKTVTFFHNIEARFFWGSFLASKTPRSLAVLVSNTIAERRAALHSDKVICLSKRDSRLLKSLYCNRTTYISPIALHDKAPSTSSSFSFSANTEPFMLFVGGNFYGNRVGITWFVRNVVPLVDIKLYIIGQGMELLKKKLDVANRVEVVGSVPNLSDWYYRCHFVIAPILDGSGMKTKVAESLMYGKKVIGTPEAFSGYDAVKDDAGWICSSPQQFANAIQSARSQTHIPCDPTLRILFDRYYSFDSAKQRITQILI